MPKLDPELVRVILLKAEEFPPSVAFGEIVVEGVDPHLVSYHIQQLVGAGLITGVDCSTNTLDWQVKSLTYDGHRLLDTIRSNKSWTAVKEETVKRGWELSLEVVKVVALRLLTGSM